MATETKINDIASQLNTASRLVVSTDFFWIYMANGSQVKIPAEFARAYLIAGIKPVINNNGHWEIGGEDLGVVAEGKTPQFRGGAMGIEVSYDNGKTWSQVVAYTDIDPDLEALAAAYTKVTQGEADRVKAESTRNSNETSRQNAETTRNNNETARKTAEVKRQQDTSAAITNSKTQTDLAKELNDNPLKQGDNGNWWKYNPQTKVYEDTGIAAIGGILYPSFSNHRNHLYLIDYQQYVSNRVSYNRNHLRIKI